MHHFAVFIHVVAARKGGPNMKAQAVRLGPGRPQKGTGTPNVKKRPNIEIAAHVVLGTSRTTEGQRRGPAHERPEADAVPPAPDFGAVAEVPRSSQSCWSRMFSKRESEAQYDLRKMP